MLPTAVSAHQCRAQSHGRLQTACAFWAPLNVAWLAFSFVGPMPKIRLVTIFSQTSPYLEAKCSTLELSSKVFNIGAKLIKSHPSKGCWNELSCLSLPNLYNKVFRDVRFRLLRGPRSRELVKATNF